MGAAPPGGTLPLEAAKVLPLVPPPPVPESKARAARRSQRSPEPPRRRQPTRSPRPARTHLSWFWKNSVFSKHSYTQPGANRATENPCFRISSSDCGDSGQGRWTQQDTPAPGGPGFPGWSLSPTRNRPAGRGLQVACPRLPLSPPPIMLSHARQGRASPGSRLWNHLSSVKEWDHRRGTQQGADVAAGTG